jgi:C-terminal processing protease CtpA/Prc
MTMYNLDGEIIIDDIIEGTPADKSGLKNGDIIMAINNNFSGNMESYKNLLQKPGTKVEVLVMRNKVPLVISLKVGRIR